MKNKQDNCYFFYTTSQNIKKKKDYAGEKRNPGGHVWSGSATSHLGRCSLRESESRGEKDFPALNSTPQQKDVLKSKSHQTEPKTFTAGQ